MTQEAGMPIVDNHDPWAKFDATLVYRENGVSMYIFSTPSYSRRQDRRRGGKVHSAR